MPGATRSGPPTLAPAARCWRMAPSPVAQVSAQAHQVREELRGRLQGLVAHVDVVRCPTMPSTVPGMDAQGQAQMAEGLVRTR